MELDNVTSVLNTFCEIEHAEPWDNVGLVVCPVEPSIVHKVLVCEDATPKVVQEAIDCSAELIVSYHPILFHPTKRLNPSCGPQVRAACLALCHNIAVYCPHTSLDVKHGGVTDWLAEKLATTEGAGSVEQPDGERQAAARVIRAKEGEFMDIELVGKALKEAAGEGGYVRIARGVGSDGHVKSVCVVVGSGGDVFKDLEADAYVTGEMQYHDVLAQVNKGKDVLLSEHSATERGYLKEVFVPKLRELLGNDVDVLLSSTDKEILRLL